jgi:hypothetical protein
MFSLIFVDFEPGTDSMVKCALADTTFSGKVGIENFFLLSNQVAAEVKEKQPRKRSNTSESDSGRRCKKRRVDLDKEEETEPREKAWFDGCEYQCKVEGCDQMFFESQVLIAHVQKKHGLPLVDYQVMNG